ncbi:MAG: hypothetical protein AAGB93_10820 [Planctomycetota bacterium]
MSIVLRSGPKTVALVAAGLAALSGHADAQGTPFGDDLVVSYLYAAVMGTGTYTVRGRRITMFRLPLAMTLREPTESRFGYRVQLPVVLGYDDLTEVGSDLIESLLPDQLVTLTVLPGIETIHPIATNWNLKPFIQVGGGQDFSLGETFAMTHLGVRSRAQFELDESWDVLLGTSARWAAEHQFESDDTTSFGVFEFGVEGRCELPFSVDGDAVDVGAYYVLQSFVPEWRIGEAPGLDQNARDLHEFGLSFGFRRRDRILGLPVHRVRVGYKKGGSFQGWTIGTDFPF